MRRATRHGGPRTRKAAVLQDRLTAGRGTLDAAMQVRILLLDPTVAVTGKATAAPAKRVHAGSSPARNSTPSGELANAPRSGKACALVAQWTERRASTSGRCGFESCRGCQSGGDRRRPRSSTDQSGGFRCPRLRVRVAPWTPASAATTAAAVAVGFPGLVALRTRDNVSGLESWPSGKAPRC